MGISIEMIGFSIVYFNKPLLSKEIFSDMI